MADPGLVTTVALVENRKLLGCDVTLFLSGIVVTGTIASTLDYATWLGNSMAEALQRGSATDPPPPADDVAARLLGQALPNPSALESLGERPSETQPTDEYDPDELEFINLHKPTIWTPALQKPITVEFWRGRMDFVGGWILGRLAPDSPR